MVSKRLYLTQGIERLFSIECGARQTSIPVECRDLRRLFCHLDEMG